MVEYILIIKYLLNNNLYNKYINYIDTNNENKEVIFLYNCLKDLHTTYQRDLSLQEYCLYCMSKVSDKERETVESILSRLEDATIDDHLIGDILSTLRNKKLAYELALVSLDVSEGRSSVDKIFDKLNVFEQQKVVEQVEFVSGDLN